MREAGPSFIPDEAKKDGEKDAKKDEKKFVPFGYGVDLTPLFSKDKDKEVKDPSIWAERRSDTVAAESPKLFGDLIKDAGVEADKDEKTYIDEAETEEVTPDEAFEEETEEAESESDEEDGSEHETDDTPPQSFEDDDTEIYIQPHEQLVQPDLNAAEADEPETPEALEPETEVSDAEDETLQDEFAERTEATGPATQSGEGGEGPPLPPENAEGAFAEPEPEPESEPEDNVEREPEPQAGEATPPPPEEPPTSPEASSPFPDPFEQRRVDAEQQQYFQPTEAAPSRTTEYYTDPTVERRAVGAGAVAGGVAGWFAGKLGRRKLRGELREETHERKKETKELKEADTLTASRVDAVEQANQRLAQHVENLQASSGRRTPEITPRPLEVQEVQAAQAQPETTAAMNQVEETAASEETLPRVPESSRQTEPERLTAAKTPELPTARPLQPDEVHNEYEVARDRRVETSAWHRIELDKKTGKVVEQPEVAYGDEFNRERQREMLHPSEWTNPDELEQLGGVAASSVGVSPAGDSGKSSDETEKRKEATIELRDAVVQNLRSPAFWIAATLVVIAILIVSLAR